MTDRDRGPWVDVTHMLPEHVLLPTSYCLLVTDINPWGNYLRISIEKLPADLAANYFCCRIYCKFICEQKSAAKFTGNK